MPFSHFACHHSNATLVGIASLENYVFEMTNWGYDRVRPIDGMKLGHNDYQEREDYVPSIAYKCFHRQQQTPFNTGRYSSHHLQDDRSETETVTAQLQRRLPGKIARQLALEKASIGRPQTLERHTYDPRTSAADFERCGFRIFTRG